MIDETTSWSVPFAVSDMRPGTATTVDVQPDAATRAALADALNIRAIRKLRLTGEISAVAQRDWQFRGRLGATVVQDCVVTLEAVTTRIDEPVTRLFQAEFDEPDPGSETEMSGDDNAEPLGKVIDAGRIMAEALALALPAYPRKPGAEMAGGQVTAPGLAPMSDADARPFSGLSGLKKSLSKDGADEG